MKRLVILICCFTAISLHAKQSTFLYFEDKNGLRDSLEIALGLADEEIDAIPLLTPEEAKQAFADSTCWILLQKYSASEGLKYLREYAYIPYNGLVEGEKKGIIFPANRLPVTISWNKQFFIDNELPNSVMSDMVAWFDAGCADGEVYKVLLAESDSCVIHYTHTGDLCSYDLLEDILVKVVGIALGTSRNQLEGIDNITITKTISKRIEDGQLLILCNGKTYNAQGVEVR